jgi:hypothetical protein
LPSAKAPSVCVSSIARRSCRPALPSRFTPGAAASTTSHPNVRDDRDTPLVGDEMARFLELIWGRRKQEYFRGKDWTGQITLIRFRKLTRARDRFPSPSYALLMGTVIPGRCEASNPESRDSGFAATAAPRNDEERTHAQLLRICMPNIAPHCLTRRLWGTKLRPCTLPPIHRDIRPHSLLIPVRHG